MITLTDNPLKIGQVAIASGLPVRTIRYYETIGLLTPTVQRTDASYRVFDIAVLSRLAFIRRCQTLGLSLEEIAQILQVYDQGERPCHDIKEHLLQKVSDIEQKIQDLQTLRSQILQSLTAWESKDPLNSDPTVICPILQQDGVGINVDRGL
jgi:DNA-binding transcriptional MerR regulator